jgi:NADP-dependent 3-hydroxy acid dehydrogenase YdfG
MTTVGVATGAGSGMGLACARRMADIVDVVVLADRDEGSLVKVMEQTLGGSALGEESEPAGGVTESRKSS